MGSTRRLRSLVVGLMVVLGLSSVGVASASAAMPEMVNKEGKALVKSKFTGASASGTELNLVTTNNGAITCSGGVKSSGEVTGLQTSRSKWTWTGCHYGRENLETEGAKSGEIVIPELKGQLVYEAYEKDTEFKPALLLTLAKEIKLGTIVESLHIKGSFLVAVEAKEFLTEMSVDAQQSGGRQAGSGEYEETLGGELKKAGLVTKGEGAKKFENGTALEFDEKRTFEEEFKINA